jgi:hypothetical protein
LAACGDDLPDEPNADLSKLILDFGLSKGVE